MNGKENKGFFETVFEGLSETAAKHINQRLRDVTPLAIDWFIDLLKNFGVEKYNEIKANRQKENPKPLLNATQSNSAGSPTNLRYALEKYKSNMNDQGSQQGLIESVSIEVANNYEFWEELSLFTQEVKCPRCGETIINNWYDYVAGESSSERNMGTEVIYSIECEDCLCPICKTVFAVKGFICSYPDNIYDSHNLKALVS